MTEEQALKKLSALVKAGDDDIELAHHLADEVLTEFLRGLGYLKIVNQYTKVKKWYA